MSPFRHRPRTAAGVVLALAAVAILHGSCTTWPRRNLHFEAAVADFYRHGPPGQTFELFNGENLAGWAVHGWGRWRVVDGELHFGGGLGYLATRFETFGDFRLDLEVKAPPGANGGVFVRARHPRGLRPYPVGLEAQIHGDGDPYPTGSLYGRLPAPPGLAPADRWYTLTVILQGETLEIRLDDTTTARGTVAPGQGFIALQGHDPWSNLAFRRIALTPLGEPAQTNP